MASELRRASSGLQVRYTFNANGYLEAAHNDDASNQLYWQLNADTPTQTSFTFGNGVTTDHAYDAVTGTLDSIRSWTFGHTHDVQDLEYAFDSIGNLTRRTDSNRDREESIDAATGYDELNRVKTVERKVASTQATLSSLSVGYDALGNITSKSGIGTYGYGNPSGCSVGYAGPHAVTSAGGEGFCYDANGNEVSGYDFTTGGTRETSWTPFNKPAEISDGTDTIGFKYGADRARFEQVNSYTGVTTLYIDGLFERETAGGAVTDSHYIYAAGEPVAIYKSHDDGSEETLYLHRDHLGNVVEITDETGTVVESYSYDAFGRRREASDWSDATGEITGANTARGYTGHEHLEGVTAAIHMNGRVYDAALGRMLSPDPYVQFPGFSQSYNRYSYVLNNPLRYTDPTGYETYTRGYMTPILGYTYTDRTTHQVVGTCPWINGQCGGMTAVRKIWPPDDDVRHIEGHGVPHPEMVWLSFGRDYDNDLERTFGVIGYNYISISVSYQGWVWPTFSGSDANNASTGIGEHAQKFENPDVGGQGSVVLAAHGNRNSVPDGGALLGLLGISTANAQESGEDRVACVMNGGGCDFSLNPNPTSTLYPIETWIAANRGFSQVGALNGPIEDAAGFWGLDADLIRAVMYYENTAGGLKDWVAGDRGNSIQPMNVGRQWAGRFGLSVEALRNPRTNVGVGAQILSGIIGNLPANASVAEVYTLYNNLNATRVHWRGVQVQRIYDERLWESRSVGRRGTR